MTIAIVLGLVLLWVIPIRPLAGHVAYKSAAKYPPQKGVPDGCDWSDGWTFAVLWPITIPVWLLLGLLVALVKGGGCIGRAIARRLPSVTLGAEAAYHREQERQRREDLVTRYELGDL